MGPDIPKPSERNDMIIYPGDSIQQPIALVEGGDLKAIMTNPQQALFVNGVVVYRDIFNHQHTTRFCFYWDAPHIVAEAHGFCLHGNNAN